MNYVREYWRKIESGEIVTSRRVKAVYGRLMAEMDSPAADSPYYFDEETGERPIIFIERFCKQVRQFLVRRACPAPFSRHAKRFQVLSAIILW